METKILIIFLSIVACTMVGYKLSQHKIMLERYYEELLLFCDEFVSELSYRKNKLIKVVEEKIPNTRSKLVVHLGDFIAARKCGNEVLLTKGILDAKQYLCVTNFFNSLGSADALTQINETNNYKSRFALTYESLKEHNRKYSALLIKLGFIAGLAIGILLL